ncbi:MAG: porin [Polyangiales bacterium]
MSRKLFVFSLVLFSLVTLGLTPSPARAEAADRVDAGEDTERAARRRARAEDRARRHESRREERRRARRERRRAAEDARREGAREAPTPPPSPFEGPEPQPPEMPSFADAEPAPPVATPIADPVEAAPGPTAEALPPPTPAPEEPKKEPAWYEKLKIRGYTQMRYNRIPGIKRNDDLKNPQGDRFLGRDNGFGFRRARLILYGDVHERLSVYLQPDFANTISGDPLNVTMLRDWYADVYLTKSKTLRIRLGQSKVPYGFENMQSSQNRLPLDRNDALNSAVKDERDIGVFMYWAPAHIRKRFKELVDQNLKGSGDYGVIGLGVYNGQTANKPAKADHMHFVGRLTWPFALGAQFLEIGGGGYVGKYRVSLGDEPGDVVLDGDDEDVDDARAFGSIALYPQPCGIQAEGTYGVGPSLGWVDTKRVAAREIYGGYATLMCKIDGVAGTVALFPFARATYYDGGKKFDALAPRHRVKELELGIEWQLIKALELVLVYDMAERTVQAAKRSAERGHVGRVQVQWNY